MRRGSFLEIGLLSFVARRGKKKKDPTGQESCESARKFSREIMRSSVFLNVNLRCPRKTCFSLSKITTIKRATSLRETWAWTGGRIIKNCENRRTVSRVAVRAPTKLDYFSQLLPYFPRAPRSASLFISFYSRSAPFPPTSFSSFVFYTD